MMDAYKGEVYKAASGQWSWRISDHQGELCGGAGYATEEEAQEDMVRHLCDHQGAGYEV